MKKISVITPSLNSEKYIERAIKSVVEQNYPNFEHIIIDACSTDNTLAILKKYPHIKYISEKDKGQSDAMNKGFNLSTGEIIVYLNSDDYFKPNIFSLINNTFQNYENTDIIFGKVEMINPQGEKNIQDPSINYKDILEHWKILFPINPVQYFYKRELQEKIPFNINNHLAMDHEFLLSICKNTKIIKLDKIFGVFDMVDGSKTAEGTKEPENYWTIKNFSYIDNFLSNFDNKYILEFKNNQINFFNENYKRNSKNKAAHLHNVENHLDDLKNEIKFLKEKSKRLTISQIENLKSSLCQYERVIIYGAGEQTNSIFYALNKKIEYIVDKNFTTIQKIENINVFSPDYISKENNPVILVTAIGYKKEITQQILDYNNDSIIIFLEDFFHE